MSLCKKMALLGRRQFLGGGAVAGATAVLTSNVARAGRTDIVSGYPSRRLANISDLKIDEPMDIEYPDSDSPGVLLKFAHTIAGGVGPAGDIVAYSVLCPHKGYQMFYDKSDRSLNCPGHFSRFDCEAGGQQIWGHATQNLPQFLLRVDAEGEIYAEGVSDLIFGRPSNVL